MTNGIILPILCHGKKEKKEINFLLRTQGSQPRGKQRNPEERKRRVA